MVHQSGQIAYCLEAILLLVAITLSSSLGFGASIPTHRASSVAFRGPGSGVPDGGTFPIDTTDIHSNRQCLLSPDSTYRDDTPLITIDGRMMYFNSTRYGGRSWAKLNKEHNRFDDDIYFMNRLDNS